MQGVGMSDSSLVHITRREFVINCNWKVFADNYLDGGYHVSTAAAAAGSVVPCGCCRHVCARCRQLVHSCASFHLCHDGKSTGGACLVSRSQVVHLTGQQLIMS
jgi:hypothetical protein